MPFKTHKQAEAATDAAKAFYRESIQNSVQKHGSVNALAKYLGKTTSTVQAIIRRDKFAPLRRLAGEINDD